METTPTTSSTTTINAAVAAPDTANTAVTTPTVPVTTASTTDFESFMKNALGGETKTEVNEEELYSALIGQKLQEASPEAGDYYKQKVQELSTSMARADGYVPAEDVASAALRATVEAGKIERGKAEIINGSAFSEAQLDENKNALYDSRGGPNDPTVAVAKMEAALLQLNTNRESIAKAGTGESIRDLDTPSNKAPGQGSTTSNGELGVAASAADAPSGTQKLDGSGGFLWKPVSESDGKLAVLMPSSLTGLVDRVEIHSSLPPSDESKVDQGRLTGVGNGNRGTYRFSKKGEDYAENSYVVCYKDDGSIVSWLIEDTAERND